VRNEIKEMVIYIHLIFKLPGAEKALEQKGLKAERQCPMYSVLCLVRNSNLDNREQVEKA